jgi:hypothetical protein
MLKSPLDSLQIKGDGMIGVAEVRPGGCIYEPCLDIMPGWGVCEVCLDLQRYTE